MFNAGIYITCDPQLVFNAPYVNQRVIAITESINELNIFPPGIVNMGTILTPNIETMAAELDKEYEVSDMMYREYLTGPVQDQFIVLMLAALYKGTNILLYIPKDEYFGLSFKNVLLDHIYKMYGVVVGTPEIQFTFDPNFFYKIIGKFYLYDFITLDEFVMSYPENVGFEQNVLAKLTNDVKPVIMSTDPNVFNDYFMRYVKNCHNANKPLTIPIGKL